MKKILTPGEKLKLYRNKYNIKQKDLCKGIMSPSMLSSIEKNTYSLNKNFAEKLIFKLNLITGLNFNVNHLLESKIEQRKKYLRIILEKMKNKKLKKLEIEEIINIFSEKNVDFKIKIKCFSLISNYAMKNKININIEKLLKTSINISIKYEYFKFLNYNILLLQRFYLSKNKYFF